MPNPKKEQIVSELTEAIKANQALILTDYRGLSHSQMTELRRKCTEAGAKLAVVKNRLFKLALAASKRPDIAELLSGPTAVAFALEDPQPAAKVLTDFAKEFNLPEFKGGLVGSDIVSQEELVAMGKLPPREILLSQLVGAVESPIQSFVGTANEILASFVRTIQAIADEAPAS